MSNISLRLPDSLHKRIKILAKNDNVSINQFIATSVAEKLSAIETEDYLANRAKKANLKKFKKVLSKVPNTKPEDFDKL